jgi:hypothetical protein
MENCLPYLFGGSSVDSDIVGDVDVDGDVCVVMGRQVLFELPLQLYAFGRLQQSSHLQSRPANIKQYYTQ